MFEERREDVVRAMIGEFVNTRPLGQIRNLFSLAGLARSIISRLEAEFSIWRKWSLPREAFAKSAVGCWIPLEDLRAFLNEIPGPELTLTDVAQRLRAFGEEDCEEPNPQLKDACLEIFKAEKALGTEMAAIVSRLKDFVDTEEVRLIHEQIAQQQRQAEEARLALEQRFVAGEDCRWTAVAGSDAVYCRVNGRAYRLAAKEGKLRSLYRIASMDDPAPRLIGKYLTRADAAKAISEVAYQPERWRE